MKKIGREVNFLATSEQNPRNGEGSFIRLNDGTIMFAFTEFFGGSWDDDESARISCIISSDEGETWSEKKILFSKPPEAKNIMSFSFLRMNNGDIGAFYIVKNADMTDDIMFTRSADEGETWSEPKSTFDTLKIKDYYVINNDRVVRLSDGRIIFAVARHTVLTEHKGFMPGIICFFISDDDGESWYKTETELECPFPNNSDGYEEPGIYELSDGRLRCYIRTNMGFQFEAFSFDKGISWSVPEPNLFFSSPCSPMLVKDFGNKTLAIFNPVPEHVFIPDDNNLWGRTPYVIAVSDDKGKTFGKDKMFYIEDDLTNGYCYPALLDCGEYFLLAYYHSNNTGLCLNSTKIIKVMREEIE